MLFSTLPIHAQSTQDPRCSKCVLYIKTYMFGTRGPPENGPPSLQYILLNKEPGGQPRSQRGHRQREDALARAPTESARVTSKPSDERCFLEF